MRCRTRLGGALRPASLSVTGPLLVSDLDDPRRRPRRALALDRLHEGGDPSWGTPPVRLSQKSWPLAEIRVAVGNPCLMRAPPEGGLKPDPRHLQSRTGPERAA